MDDTLLVRRVELRPPRRVTTQFGPERRPLRWPWVGAAALLLSLAALGEPWNPARDHRLSEQASEVLRLLP